MSEAKGKLIVIEGIDGSGKKTQQDLLVKRFLQKGISVVTDDYPHYESSFWGKHVGRMLAKEWGNPMQITPYLTALPYMLDEADGSKKIIKPALDNGKIIVSNRYFTSTVHQIAKMPEGEQRDNFANWIWHAGYDELNIVRPDLVIVLLVDPLICQENILQKAKRNYTQGHLMDAAEEDFNHQMESASEYRKMIAKEPERWTLIDCCNEGNLKSKEEIHELVWNEIKRKKII